MNFQLRVNKNMINIHNYLKRVKQQEEYNKRLLILYAIFIGALLFLSRIRK